jgi:hypothetical protein
MTSFQNDTIVFTFIDMKHLFLRHRRKILSFLWMGAVCVFALLLLRPPQYFIEASFKQSNKDSDFSSQTKKMVQQLVSSSTEGSAIVVMQSHEVIKNALERQGMQVVCHPDSWMIRVLKRIANNLCLELGGVPSDPESFQFTNASYCGEKTLKMFLKLKDHQTYQLLDANQRFLGEASVGKPLSFPLGALTLNVLPSNVKQGFLYPISVSPLLDMIKNIKARLKVFPHKLDKEVLQLNFLSSDRASGAAFLNQLMSSHQAYLKRENEEISSSQLQYLQERQEETFAQYNEALNDHVKYLQKNLEREGYIGFEQEIATLSEPKNLYTSKLFQVDLELNRLQDAISQEHLAAQLDKTEEGLPEKTLLISDLLPQEKEEELHSWKRDEFAGLNLETAQQLLVEYTRQRDSFQAQIKEFDFLTEQLKKPGFEVSSLGDVYSDGVIREQVNKASALALLLQDEDNRSAREQERLTEALQAQKNFLSHYLLQTVELKKLRLKLLNEKIVFLQQATLSLLQAEKELLKTKLHELNNRMEDLPEKWRHEAIFRLKTDLWATSLEGVSQLIEAKFLSQRAFQATSRPLDFAFQPLKPKSPRLLLYTLMSSLFLGGGFYFLLFCNALFKGLPVSDQMLRCLGFPLSGRLSRHCKTELSQIEEKDLATIRHVAEFIGAEMHNGEGVVVACIGKQYPDYSSPLAQLLTMRGKKTAVVRCVFDQTVQEEDLPGLWQYLQGEITEAPMRSHLSYDVMTSGGISRYSTEALCSSQFQSLISNLKQKYDAVLLYSNADPANRESSTLLKLADSALVTVQTETKEDLEIYQKWKEERENRKLSFLYAEEFV